MSIPHRQIRALFTKRTIRVYQAYSSRIANPAITSGNFVSPPFKMDRMTWIKPSYLWMMYRSGWGEKEGQENILAIDITREGFEWSLNHSSLSHFEPEFYSSNETWLKQKQNSPVRIQWDPERDIKLNKLDYRSIQIGLSGEAVHQYVNNWITKITPLNTLGDEIQNAIQSGNMNDAMALLPKEEVYPLSDELRKIIGIS